MCVLYVVCVYICVVFCMQFYVNGVYVCGRCGVYVYGVVCVVGVVCMYVVCVW